jgi:predicted RNase H-like HicB family nuclease
MKYHVVLKKQKRGYVVKCLELPECMSEGKTKEEALKNINDAIMLYLQDIEKEAKEKKAIALEVQV